MATAQNMDRTSRRGLTQGPTEQAVWFAIQEHGNQPPADLFNGDGQDPVLKRRAIAQDARLAPQYSNIMPWIINRPFPPERADMDTNRPAILPDLDASGISPEFHRATNRTAEEGIPTVVKTDQAGFRDRGRAGMKPVKGTNAARSARNISESVFSGTSGCI